MTAHDEESRIRSDEELIGFAERTLAALVQRETEILGHVPSISMLCRLDISVTRQSRSGQLQYWVVSVARGANVPIHGIDDSFDTLGVIADELVDALRKKPGACMCLVACLEQKDMTQSLSSGSLISLLPRERNRPTGGTGYTSGSYD